jgi:hypothetical protein
MSLDISLIDLGKPVDWVGIDLVGQQQGRAFFVIELQTSAKRTEDVVFTHTVLGMAKSAPGACEPVTKGMRDTRPRRGCRRTESTAASIASSCARLA